MKLFFILALNILISKIAAADSFISKFNEIRNDDITSTNQGLKLIKNWITLKNSSSKVSKNWGEKHEFNSQVDFNSFYFNRI